MDPVLLTALLALLAAGLWWWWVRPPNTHNDNSIWLPGEKTYLAKGKRIAFGSLFDDPEVFLSVVVPAYSEEKRLPVMLDQTLRYLHSRQARDPTFTFEVLVVDDGSKDATTAVALDYCAKEGADRMRVLTLTRNRGKGGAVKRVLSYMSYHGNHIAGNALCSGKIPPHGRC